MTVPANAQTEAAPWGSIPVTLCWGTQGGPYNTVSATNPLPSSAGGDTASGSADSGNPVKIGGLISTTSPTPGSSGNRVNAWFGGKGQLQVAACGLSPVADGTAARTITAADSIEAALASAQLAYNGTSWDRVRNNIDATALASAARTATTSSGDQVNYNNRGILVYLNVTAASGTGGLQLQVQGKDPVSGNYYNLNAVPTAVTATGQYAYVIYPGAVTAAGHVQQTTQTIIPRTFRVTATAGDSSSYTYSVGYSLID